MPRGHFVILERDGFQCGYCGRSPLRDRALLSVDHVHPVSAGGDDRALNLLTCCRTCNSQKGGGLLEPKLEAQIMLAIHARNVASGIDDNQQIDLGSTAADLRHDLEAMTKQELDALLGQSDKIDKWHWLMVMAQRQRIIFAELATNPKFDQAWMRRQYERLGLVMADIENRRYRVGDEEATLTEPMFDMISLLNADGMVWGVAEEGKDD